MKTKLTHHRRLLPVLLAAAFVLAAGAAGATVLDTRYGAATNWLAAEINGMGATGVALDRGGFGAALNPATLAWAGEWRVDAGVSLAEDHEDRFQPLFDSFGSYVVDTAIASHRNHRFGSGFAASRGFGSRFGGAVSLTTRHGFGYDFEEEIRDPDSFSDPRDRILEMRGVRRSGDLRDLGLGAAVALGEAVTLGASLHYVFGDVEMEMRDRFFLEPASSYVSTEVWEADGLTVTTGLTVRAGERLVLGAAWDLPYDVEGDATTTLEQGEPAVASATVEGVTVRYPQRARVGFALYPRSEPRTVFSAEVEWTEWSQLEDSRVEGPGTMENTRDYRVGVQHTFYNGVPVRFGFRHLDHYADPEAAQSLFTMGVGIPYAEGLLSVGAELGKVQSIQPHWFDYPEDFATAPTSRVEETLFRLGATLSYRF